MFTSGMSLQSANRNAAQSKSNLNANKVVLVQCYQDVLGSGRYRLQTLASVSRATHLLA